MGGESSLTGKPLAGEGKEQKGSDELPFGFSESSRGKVKKCPNQSPGKGRGQRREGPHAPEKALREVLGLPHPNKRGHRSAGKQRKRQILALSPLTPRPHAFWGAGIQRKKEQPKEEKITWAVKGGRDPEGQALPET